MTSQAALAAYSGGAAVGTQNVMTTSAVAFASRVPRDAVKSPVTGESASGSGCGDTTDAASSAACWLAVG